LLMKKTMGYQLEAFLPALDKILYMKRSTDSCLFQVHLEYHRKGHIIL
jgi:hypothetical protein